MPSTASDHSRPLLGTLSLVSAISALSARRSIAIVTGSLSIASAIAAIRHEPPQLETCLRAERQFNAVCLKLDREFGDTVETKIRLYRERRNTLIQEREKLAAEEGREAIQLRDQIDQLLLDLDELQQKTLASLVNKHRRAIGQAQRDHLQRLS